MSNQKDYAFEVNFSSIINSLRDSLSKRGFTIFTRGNPKDQYIHLVKEGNAEIILRMQLMGKQTRISLVSSKFTNIEGTQQQQFLQQLWQLIDSSAPRDVKAVTRSPSVEVMMRDNLARFGILDTEKFAADTGNDLASVLQVAESVSDSKTFVLTEDKRRVFARGKVKEMMLSGVKPAKKELPNVASAPICPKCGQRSKPNAFFCSACGTKLK
jgi:hypothetical protein